MGSAFVVTWLSASLRLAGPVLLAALGETFAEQSGVLNVGIEGTMLLGALASFLAGTSSSTEGAYFAARQAVGAELAHQRDIGCLGNTVKTQCGAANQRADRRNDNERTATARRQMWAKPS